MKKVSKKTDESAEIFLRILCSLMSNPNIYPKENDSVIINRVIRMITAVEDKLGPEL